MKGKNTNNYVSLTLQNKDQILALEKIPFMKFLIFPFVISIFFLQLASCRQSEKNTLTKTNTDSVQTTAKPEIAGLYDLAHPLRKWRLPEELLEISGNSYIDSTHLMVIEDLHPNLYVIGLKDTSAVIDKKIAFKEDLSGKKFDVEDVVLVNNTAYALWSHGSIYKITDWQTKPQVKEIKTFLSKENNTEGICYDPVTKNILIACKDDIAQADEKKSTRGIYQFNMTTDSVNEVPFMVIHKKDFKELTGEKESFYPSAIAVHPISHDVYILSTKETKCMAVFTHDGSLKNFQLIDRNILLQPEGMCFAPDGTLYISTEGKPGGSGFIYSFKMGK